LWSLDWSKFVVLAQNPPHPTFAEWGGCTEVWAKERDLYPILPTVESKFKGKRL